MTLWRAALVGAGRVAAPHRPGSADGCACRLDGTRAQGVCGGRVGGVVAAEVAKESSRSGFAALKITGPRQTWHRSASASRAASARALGRQRYQEGQRQAGRLCVTKRHLNRSGR